MHVCDPADLTPARASDARRGRALGRCRSGTIGLMAAMLLPALIAAVAMTTDISIWFLERQRLQLAADAAAYAGAMQLSNAALQSGAPGSFATLVSNEIQAATGGKQVGTLGTPSIAVAAGYTSITVTLSSTADIYFVGALNIGAPTIKVSATASAAAPPTCVQSLNPSASAALMLNGGGTVSAPGCNVTVNSSSGSSISMVSGSVTAQKVTTAGGTSLTSGATITPSATTGAAVVADPYASLSMPSFGGCSYASGTSFQSSGTAYHFTGGTRFCGNTSIGGNGSTASFAAGIYYFTGNTYFSNASVTIAAGVTFVVTGATASTAAPTFQFVNSSTVTFSAPTSTANGGIVGVAFWQTCPVPNASGADSNVNGTIYFSEGSTISVSGVFYAPCGTMQFDNGAVLQPVSGASANYVASVIEVTDGAKLAAANSSTAASTSVSLTQ
jgi:Flp pilus assembly protein TadG